MPCPNTFPKCNQLRSRSKTLAAAYFTLLSLKVGSGCGSVGRAVASDTEVRGSNPVIGKNLFIYCTFVYCQLCIEKTKMKKKRPGWPIFKKCIVRENFI